MDNQLGRDKSVKAKAGAKLFFKVKHIGLDQITESSFQEKPALINEYSCYFIENNISYRDIIGGFDINKIVDKKDNIKMGKCCIKIKKIKLINYPQEKFQGYCFNVDFSYE